MRPSICKIVHNHKWKQKHKYGESSKLGTRYIFKCEICGKEKEILVKNS